MEVKIYDYLHDETTVVDNAIEVKITMGGNVYYLRLDGEYPGVLRVSTDSGLVVASRPSIVTYLD